MECIVCEPSFPLLAILLSTNVGCHLMYKNAPVVEAPAPCPDETPRELYKAALPEYRIEPPDVLSIDAVRLLPGSDYKLHIQDVVTAGVFVSAETPLFNIEPAEFVVGIDGTIDLGPTYGPVPVDGLSIAEARAAVEKAVGQQVKTAQVSFRVSALPTLQPIAGEHLVGPDGMINMGIVWQCLGRWNDRERGPRGDPAPPGSIPLGSAGRRQCVRLQQQEILRRHGRRRTRRHGDDVPDHGQ